MVNRCSGIDNTKSKNGFTLVFCRRHKRKPVLELTFAPLVVVCKCPPLSAKYANRELLIGHQLKIWMLLNAFGRLLRDDERLLNGVGVGLRTVRGKAKP